MVHLVKTFRKFKWYVLSKVVQSVNKTIKWYILSKRVGNSSGLSCQNTKETQVVHPVKTLRTLKCLILSKH